MRHGRKRRRLIVDGYKRQGLRELVSRLIVAVGVTPANAPVASVTDTSASGRSVSIHPDEALLQEWRERVAVEHALAHVGHWQGRRARYRGVRKNVFDLRRCGVVHHLH